MSTSFSDRELFTASATATKAPKPNFPAPLPLMEKLKSKFSRKGIEESIDQHQQEVQAGRVRVRELATQLNSVIREVEAAQAKLARADAEFDDLKERFAAYKAKLDDVWGREPNTYSGGVRPVEQHFASYVQCERALAAYPDVRKALVLAVREKEAKLATFKKDNDLDVD